MPLAQFLLLIVLFGGFFVILVDFFFDFGWLLSSCD